MSFDSCCEASDTEPDQELNEIRKTVEKTCDEYDLCKNFFLCGLTTDEVNNTVGCMSLMLNQYTVSVYENGHHLVFCCKLCLKKDQNQRPIIEDGQCPFRWHFKKDKYDLWILNHSEKNSVRRACSMISVPELCTSQHCFLPLIQKYAKTSGKISSQITLHDLQSYFDEMGPEKSHFRTLNRALAKLKNISSEKLLETDRKIESYIRYLNSNDQYGVLLYDTGELIVPECEEGHYKLCSLQTRPNPVFCSRDEGKTTFWDGLPEIESINQNKTVLFTFEAVRVSVEAFKYSFHVMAAFIPVCG